MKSVSAEIRVEEIFASEKPTAEVTFACNVWNGSRFRGISQAKNWALRNSLSTLRRETDPFLFEIPKDGTHQLTDRRGSKFFHRDCSSYTEMTVSRAQVFHFQTFPSRLTGVIHFSVSRSSYSPYFKLRPSASSLPRARSFGSTARPQHFISENVKRKLVKNLMNSHETKLFFGIIQTPSRWIKEHFVLCTLTRGSVFNRLSENFVSSGFGKRLWSRKGRLAEVRNHKGAQTSALVMHTPE